MHSISVSAAASTSAASAFVAPFTHSDMLYAIGVYHPEPGKHDLPPDYALSREELQKMPLDNVPVTMEHAGIHEAVTLLKLFRKPLEPKNVGSALDGVGQASPYKRPVGIVMQNFEARDRRWYCLLAIDIEAYPSLRDLIALGALRGLSLTHEVSSMTALEVSLCVRPARPECHILRTSTSLLSQLDYMRELITRERMSEQTPLQKVINSLSEEDKALVTARFEDLMKAVDAANQQATEAKNDLVAANKAVEDAKSQAASNEVNMDVVARQIKIMADQLNPELKDTFYCDPDNLIEEMKSKDPVALLRATDRMICACNKQMMELRANNVVTSEPPSRKRKLSENEVADPLARALAETFELE